MDIATISHKSKLSLGKINRAVRLETLGDSNWRGLISKEHSEALSIYVIFFILLQVCMYTQTYFSFLSRNKCRISNLKSTHSY